MNNIKFDDIYNYRNAKKVLRKPKFLGVLYMSMYIIFRSFVFIGYYLEFIIFLFEHFQVNHLNIL